MTTIVIAMLVILTIAGLVTVYVAFPHRGENLPAVPWLGHAMRKGVDSLPVLDEHERVN